MAFTLIAPLPLTETTTVLPNPKFGDAESATVDINILRTINGRRRTYVKTKSPQFSLPTFGKRRKLRWDFVLTRNKAIELFEFYRSYNASPIYINDHNERGWIGWIVINPFEITMARRGAPARQDWAVGETCTVTIEFEGARTEIDLSASQTHAPTAQSEIEAEQFIFADIAVPAQGSLKHNWDANQLLVSGHTDNALVNTWPDIGYANNDLIPKIGALFDPFMNRAPTFRKRSFVFPGLPTVSFERVFGAVVIDSAAMVTTNNTTLFPNRRGTVFWVHAHTISPSWQVFLQIFRYPTLFSEEEKQRRADEAMNDNDFLDKSNGEYGFWGLQNSSLDNRVEQVHIAGGSHPSFPLTARFNPANASNNIELATSSTGAIPAFQPTIFMLQRNNDTNLRLRTNGIERSGATILNNPGYTGKFHMNAQPWIPDFRLEIGGEWTQFLVYDKALSEIDILAVERFLSIRWGIPLNEVGF
ncbi:MAG: hypothetical protein ACW987_14010 [Candidatus Thorarchaeota archaeon]|jgi:hypothetical protein